MTNKIELISVNILNNHRPLVNQLNDLNKTLALSSGWHYPMDWTWVISQLGDVAGKNILDAGAGIGLLQWFLAQQGAKVISVDRSDRTCIPFHLLKRFNVEGLKDGDKPLSLNEILQFQNRKSKLTRKIKTLIRGSIGEVRSRKHLKNSPTGSVTFYNQDLKSLSSIPNNSMDYVVSISALEHNKNIDNVKEIILELKRVLTPGGLMLVTLPATNESDWFFQPAFSWCFTVNTLKYIFDLQNDTNTNFNQYELLFNQLKNSTELRKNISLRYYYSPNSGMPWGIWNPQYMPVGILITKH